jgi:hypothetical protein
MSTATETAMTTWERWKAGLEARSDEERRRYAEYWACAASDADWAFARQKYIFGGKPAGEFEEYAFSLLDATRAVSA